jgi:hypothetical protein
MSMRRNNYDEQVKYSGAKFEQFEICGGWIERWAVELLSFGTQTVIQVGLR